MPVQVDVYDGTAAFLRELQLDKDAMTKVLALCCLLKWQPALLYGPFEVGLNMHSHDMQQQLCILF